MGIVSKLDADSLDATTNTIQGWIHRGITKIAGANSIWQWAKPRYSGAGIEKLDGFSNTVGKSFLDPKLGASHPNEKPPAVGGLIFDDYVRFSP